MKTIKTENYTVSCCNFKITLILKYTIKATTTTTNDELFLLIVIHDRNNHTHLFHCQLEIKIEQ